MSEETDNLYESIRKSEKKDCVGQTKFQVYSAVIGDQSHIDRVLSYLKANVRDINQYKSCIIAFRVDQNDDSAVAEGFDDSNEEGCGQKLLSLL